MAASPELARPPHQRGAPVIDVEDVRKSYGDVRAVDGVSFQVAPGEIFGLLGPNGAGKTTTMEMLEGLHPPDSGRLTVLGLDVRHRATEIKERIGVQLQTPALFPQLTVEELLKALAHAGRAFARGFGCTAWYERSPMLEPLRGLPKWKALMQHLRERQGMMEDRFPIGLLEDN